MSGKVTDNIGRASGLIKVVSAEGGLDVADQWRITSDKAMATTGDAFTANWERVDTGGQGTITGSQMSESSGIFTFPSTGIYAVTFRGIMYTSNNAAGTVKIGLEIHATTDDSAYAAISQGFDWNPSNQFTFKQVDVNSLMDVTDTANVKVKFLCMNSGTNNSDRVWEGSTSINNTYATFTKLGAT